MKRSKLILGLKAPSQFSLEERKIIIEEYLQSGCQKREIWEKYTGRSEEKGSLLRWMRQLGYDNPPQCRKLGTSLSIDMAKKSKNQSSDQDLLKRVKELEKALVESELRATALDTMIEVAENELKINIRKKSFTKQSSK